MVAAISLGFYSIRIEDKNTNDFKLVSSHIDKISWLECFNKILNPLQDPSKNEDSRKVLKLCKNTFSCSEDDNLLKGFLESGEYGYESTLYNVETDKTRTKSREEAELLPFYFHIKIPKNDSSQYAILCLEKFAQYGIKTVLEKHFQRHFRENHSDFRVEIAPIVPKKMIESIINEGSLKKLRFSKFNHNQNIEDDYAGKERSSTDYRLESSLSPISRGGCLGETVKQLVLKLVSSQLSSQAIKLNQFSEFTQLVEMFELKHSDFQGLKVEISQDGKQKTLDMSNFENFNAFYDISDSLTFEDSGHPNFRSIDELARSYLKELMNTLGKS